MTNSAQETNKDANYITQPRLHKLKIKNFRAIGPAPVTIDLDEIVVLVGPNNSGKSSILKAYEVVMSDGSNESKLTMDDFPNKRIDPNNVPEIELYSVVDSNTSPGEKWIDASTGGENCKRKMEMGKARDS